MKTTTKYALRYHPDLRHFLAQPGRSSAEGVDGARLFDSLVSAMRDNNALHLRDYVPVAVDITESPETLAELPTLQYGPDVVFAFLNDGLGYFAPRTRKFTEDAPSETFDTNTAAITALQQGNRASGMYASGIRLVALKRTSGAPTYTVRELK